MTNEELEAIRARDECYSQSMVGYGYGVRDRRALLQYVEELRAQLPEEMQHCTILFEECPVGHGGLRAANWIKHECAICEIDRLRVALQMVAEQTICPDLFPLETDEDRLAYKTAFVIATAALEHSTDAGEPDHG